VPSLFPVTVVPGFVFTAIGAHDYVISGFQELFTIDTLSVDMPSCVATPSPTEFRSSYVMILGSSS
jgi:hypothetical protein